MMPRLLSLLGAAAFLLGTGCTKAPPPGTTAAPLPTARVRVEMARTETVPVFTEVSGTIRPLQRAQIAARLMGAIEEMPVTLGQRVRADQQGFDTANWWWVLAGFVVLFWLQRGWLGERLTGRPTMRR